MFRFRIPIAPILLCLCLIGHDGGAADATEQDSPGSALPEVVREADLPPFVDEDALSDEQKEYRDWAFQLLDGLEFESGDIELPNGVAVLHLGDAFRYLSPEHTEAVLSEVWGNPPGSQTQGMIVPAGTTPFDESAWGMIIGYAEDGYVDDDGAEQFNFDEWLDVLRDAVAKGNPDREAAGFGALELVGWAATPQYDQQRHILHWAKEYTVAGVEHRTLNYDVRVLGRRGVLEMNIVAGMNQLEQIQKIMPELLATTEFNDGYRYAQFDAELDSVAPYRFGGLVTGKEAPQDDNAWAHALSMLREFWYVAAFVLVGFTALSLRKRGTS